MNSKIKALTLFSGGLDSMLSIKLLAEQNIDVTAIHINTGFGSKDENFEILKHRAGIAGAKFEVVDIKNKFLQNILFNPKYGYGKHFNPCIDCHGYMFKTALNLMPEFNASFIATGEVVGQRPMSQRISAMNEVKKLASKDDIDLLSKFMNNKTLRSHIEKFAEIKKIQNYMDVDISGFILRPMSAKLLTPTIPEILNIVDRRHLLNISGRGRSTQLELAKKYNFDDFQTPGGGCLLTLENFSQKIKDSIKFEKIEDDKDIDILKFGRHLRLPNNAKMIIGKNEKENNKLQAINNKKFEPITILDVPGAFCLISKNAQQSDIELALNLAIVYAKTDLGKIYKVRFRENTYEVELSLNKSDAAKYFIGN